MLIFFFLFFFSHCWLMFNLVPTRFPWLFSANFFLAEQFQTYTLAYTVVVSFLHRNFTHLLVELHQITVSLSRSLWVTAQPSVVSATTPSFVLSAKLLRVCSALSLRSLMMMLNGFGTSVAPWDAVAATDHHPLALVFQAIFDILHRLLFKLILQ